MEVLNNFEVPKSARTGRGTSYMTDAELKALAELTNGQGALIPVNEKYGKSKWASIVRYLLKTYADKYGFGAFADWQVGVYDDTRVFVKRLAGNPAPPADDAPPADQA